MQPRLPFIPNMKKKIAFDHTDNLKNQLSFLVKSFDLVELISIISTLQLKETLVGGRVHLFTELPGLNFLIDLCLVNKDESKTIPTARDVYNILDMLDHYFLSVKDSITSDYYEDEFDKSMLVFDVRMHAMLLSINREKYVFQQNDYMKGIYPKLDQHFENKFGFTVTDSIDISLAIWTEFDSKVHTKYDEIFQKTAGFNYDKEKALQFYSTFSENDANQFIKTVNESLSDPKELYITNIHEFCKKYGFPLSKVEIYLSYFSCKFGDNLANTNIPFGEFFINYKPLIRLSQNEFFYPIPDLVYWNIPIILENIIKKNEGADSKIWHKLDHYKEEHALDKIEEFLSRLIPKQQIHKNLYYYDSEGKRLEIDVLAHYDNKILIFEEKSKNLSPRAKFGKLDRLESDLKSIVEYAFSQTSNAEKYILTSNEAKFVDSNDKPILTIDKSHKKQIYHINVTLEPYRTLLSILGKLKPLGLFENDEYPWAVYLYDLDIITHILEGKPSIFIHYVKERIKSHEHIEFTQSEEIQLFDWYLSFLNLQPFDSKNKSIILIMPTDSFTKFDDYYKGVGKKPSINIDAKTYKIIKKLENKQEFGFTDKVIDLLNKIRSSPFYP